MKTIIKKSRKNDIDNNVIKIDMKYFDIETGTFKELNYSFKPFEQLTLK